MNTVIEFLKKNWLVLVVIVALVIAGIQLISAYSDLSSRNRSLENLVEQQQERTLQNLAEITNSFQRQIEQQEKFQIEFNSRIEELDRKYTEKLSEIQTKQRAQQRSLANNPATIPTAFTEVFGIPERGASR